MTKRWSSYKQITLVFSLKVYKVFWELYIYTKIYKKLYKKEWKNIFSKLICMLFLQSFFYI